MVNAIRYLHLRSIKQLAGQLEGLIRTRLWLKILIGMILGIGIGLLLGPSVGWLDSQTAHIVGGWLALPGHLFLAIIQMVVVPLIFSSVIRGLAGSEDTEQLKKLGLRVVVYFVITTTLAIAIGLSVALIIKPGEYVETEALQRMIDFEASEVTDHNVTAPGIDNLPETIIEILPENPIGSMVRTEMLQIVIFSVFIGLALLALPPVKAKPLLDLFGSLQAVCMKVIGWAMYLAPVAVFGLMCNLTATIGLDVLFGMTVYVGAVLLGLFLLFLLYLLIAATLGRRSPLEFLSNIKEVQLMAFSTSSSAAVMPLSVQAADNKLKVRPSISQFIIPLGATINMDGTALYQGVAAVFLAQVFGVELTLAALLFVVVTTVSASIGAPATPGVGIVILAAVLKGIGVPVGGIALIIGVDRILDMSRTAINVTGDLTACTVMDRFVSGKTTAQEQLNREAVMDTRREITGEDTLEETPQR